MVSAGSFSAPSFISAYSASTSSRIFSAPAVAIVDAQRRLEISKQLVLGQELAQGLADHRRAAKAAAHDHLEADLALFVAPQAQADVMHTHGGAVVGRAGDGDLELARQEAELGMQRRPLAHDLAPDARILDLVDRGAGEMIGRDVANDVAGGLHGVHVDFGKCCQGVGGVLELDPVELQVLAGGEMAVAAVVRAGDVGQLAELAGRQRAVGNGDPQHVGVELKVEPVGQAQRLELRLGELARQAAAHLVAELLDALGDQRAVVVVVTVEMGVRHSAPRRRQWRRR
jgi:hypothetical protein